MSAPLPPTATRLRELRLRGEWPRARTAVAAAAVVGVVAGLWASATTTAGALRELFGQAAAALAGAPGASDALWEPSARLLVEAAVPPLAAGVGLAALVVTVQLGWPPVLRWPWQRDDAGAPLGAGALLERAALGAGKLAAIAAVAAAGFPDVHEVAGASTTALATAFAASARDALLALSLLMTVLGVVHYGWEQRRFRNRARMTPAQLRQELRELEGDPQIKARRQRARRRAARAAGARAAIRNPGENA